MQEFYVVIEGQKKGPFDIIDIIKKVKNGIITAESKVSTSADGEFVPATSIEEIKLLIEEHGAGGDYAPKSSADAAKSKLRLGRSLSEGMNLWLKYVLSFTVISGLILAVSFGLHKGAFQISFIAEYQTVGNYIISVITAFFYIIFFNYILLAKRNQTTQLNLFFKTLAKKIPAMLVLAMIFSVYTIAYGVSELIGLVVLLGLLFVTTFYIFAPFLLFDREVGVGGATATSIKKVGKAGIDNFGVILTLITINLIVAILPAFFAKDLFVFGLFISIPITVSALAFIYDEIFA